MAKEAFCLIMWKAHGGQLTSEGEPTGSPVKSLCEAEEEENCGTCGYMLAELNAREPGTTYLWACPDCADQSLNAGKHWDISVTAPGYYSSGLCQRPQCRRKGDDYLPGAEYSNFLQLLIVTGDRVP